MRGHGLRFTATLLAGFMVAFQSPAWAAQGRSVMVGGLPMTCAAAAQFRDGPLFARYVTALGRYDDSQARYDAGLALFEKRLRSAEARWLKAAEQEKRRLIADLLIMGLGVTAARYLPKAVESGLSAADQKVLETAVERLENGAKLAVGTAVGDVPSAREIFLDFSYPLLVLAAVAFAPAVAPVAAGTALIASGTAWAGRVFDVLLIAHSASQEFSLLADGMRRLVHRSPRTDLRILNDTKNAIDKACG